MGIYEKIKDTTKTANEVMNIPDINKLRKQLEEANKEIENLKEQLEDKSEWNRNDINNFVNDGGTEICGTCYEVNKIKCTVIPQICGRSIKLRCPTCKTVRNRENLNFRGGRL